MFGEESVLSITSTKMRTATVHRFHCWLLVKGIQLLISGLSRLLSLIKPELVWRHRKFRRGRSLTTICFP